MDTCFYLENGKNKLAREEIKKSCGNRTLHFKSNTHEKLVTSCSLSYLDGVLLASLWPV
jgi:hypothetical protein